jgi:mono/diheme cytochrome c family protein
MRRTGIFCSLLLSTLMALVSSPLTHAADAMKPAMPSVGTGHAFPQTEGAALYEAACQACHMPQGVGATAAASYPALANDPRLKPKVYPITRVLHGSRAMPAFADALSDEQIATVVSYIRSHFGNRYADRVSLDEVRAQRP